jgi:hypothetical protein
MNQCESCPVPIGSTCIAVSSRHVRFCAYPRLGGTFLRFIIEQSTGVAPSDPGIVLDAIDSSTIASIELCDFRHSDCGCLKVDARCRLAGYAVIVNLDWCVGCDVRKELRK